jgi:hypothetical protein
LAQKTRESAQLLRTRHQKRQVEKLLQQLRLPHALRLCDGMREEEIGTDTWIQVRGTRSNFNFAQRFKRRAKIIKNVGKLRKQTSDLLPSALQRAPQLHLLACNDAARLRLKSGQLEQATE